ncbi:hypothetical protein O7635_24070 [Asanoa sp. WMMD1127]|uniref:hypothetical protein n=1 Tax=Asanoa sp. WMMD1127 TaxID=3016107 RepID=UPI002417CCD8|nr:hypothetical protein [Asanoa sp. WMMD1127]MDG4824937.1 hypothetical protein [Asanoa sp. WMMD1127]
MTDGVRTGGASGIGNHSAGHQTNMEERREPSIVDTPQANTPTEDRRSGEADDHAKWRDEKTPHTGPDQELDPPDAADPDGDERERNDRIGSAGGGAYHPSSPQHDHGDAG